MPFLPQIPARSLSISLPSFLTYHPHLTTHPTTPLQSPLPTPRPSPSTPLPPLTTPPTTPPYRPPPQLHPDHPLTIPLSGGSVKTVNEIVAEGGRDGGGRGSSRSSGRGGREGGGHRSLEARVVYTVVDIPSAPLWEVKAYEDHRVREHI